jgi:hypothetical protein
MEVKHRNERDQEKHALMETKNSKDQEIAELQRKVKLTYSVHFNV